MPTLAEVIAARGTGFVTELTTTLHFEGFAGEHDFGVTRQSCPRTPWHPRDDDQQHAQISIVSIAAWPRSHTRWVRWHPIWTGLAAQTGHRSIRSPLPSVSAAFAQVRTLPLGRNLR